MTLNQLKVFVTVVEHGSIRAGARHLDTVQSGLTQQIKRLEADLGAVLFQRANSGIALTEAGEALLVRARVMLAEYDRLEQHLGQLKGETSGILNVGILSEAFMALVPQALNDLRTSYPRVVVQIASSSSTTLLDSLREGKLDFVVAQMPHKKPLSSDLTSTPLIPSRPAIICRKGHPLALARSIRELLGASWIRPRGMAGSPSNRLNDWFDQHGAGTPKVAVTIESLFDSLHLVSKSDYLFMGPRSALAEGEYGRQLTTIDVSEAIAPADICLVSRATVPLAPAARLFASMLISYARLVRQPAAPLTLHT
jgi:DNA-binding transcriptional LysR family regulator